MSRYKVAIIGCGKIGVLFDTPKSDSVLTHAHAYYNDDSFEIVGFVDMDFKKAKKASKIWGGMPFNKTCDIFQKANPDVVSICVSTKNHFKILKELHVKQLKCIVLEKPFTNSLKDSAVACSMYKASNIPVIVNYSRRFLPEFIILKEKISRGVYGKYVSGHCYYCKGILNNGSHAIDLINWLIGRVVSWKVISGKVDFQKSDPTLSASIFLDNKCFFYLIGSDHRFWDIFDIELLFEKAKIRILDSENVIEEYLVSDDPNFRGYKAFSKVRSMPFLFNDAMINLLDNVKAVIESDKKPRCTMQDAFEAQKICERMIIDFKEAKK